MPFKRMEEFIARQGLRVKPQDVEAHAASFAAEMKRGLAQEGAGSLRMLPTYIELSDGLDYSREVIVIDAGGTNLRVALVGFLEDRQLEVRYFEKYPMLGIGGGIDAVQFYDTLAEYLAPVVGRAQHIGVCFSFPSEALPNRDARILSFSKEVEIKGAIGTVIGEELRAALGRRSLPCAHSVVVINDTVASLLGAVGDSANGVRYGSYIGFILGTGLNSCYLEQNRNIGKAPALRDRPGSSVINLESGGYALMPKSEMDTAFIAATAAPEVHHFEKMSSGAYQSSLFLEYLRAAAREGLFSGPCAQRVAELETLSGLEIDQFCDLPYGDNTLAVTAADDLDKQLLHRLLDAFFDRVAMLAAVNLTAILRSLGEAAENPCQPVCISAEGTTFYKARLLRPKIDYYMEACARRELGLSYRFVKVENATIGGTAVAGLLGN